MRRPQGSRLFTGRNAHVAALLFSFFSDDPVFVFVFSPIASDLAASRIRGALRVDLECISRVAVSYCPSTAPSRAIGSIFFSSCFDFLTSEPQRFPLSRPPVSSPDRTLPRAIYSLTLVRPQRPCYCPARSWIALSLPTDMKNHPCCEPRSRGRPGRDRSLLTHLSVDVRVLSFHGNGPVIDSVLFVTGFPDKRRR